MISSVLLQSGVYTQCIFYTCVLFVIDVMQLEKSLLYNRHVILMTIYNDWNYTIRMAYHLDLYLMYVLSVHS